MSVDELTDPAVEPPGVSEQRNVGATPGERLFSKVDIEGFRQDDETAGRAIAKILVSLFCYTVIIMIVVIWWTLRTVG